MEFERAGDTGVRVAQLFYEAPLGWRWSAGVLTALTVGLMIVTLVGAVGFF